MWHIKIDCMASKWWSGSDTWRSWDQVIKMSNLPLTGSLQREINGGQKYNFLLIFNFLLQSSTFCVHRLPSLNVAAHCRPTPHLLHQNPSLFYLISNLRSLIAELFYSARWALQIVRAFIKNCPLCPSNTSWISNSETRRGKRERERVASNWVIGNR